MSAKEGKQEQVQETAEQVVEIAEDKYWDALEVKEIATKLIQVGAFQFPTNTPICYVFVDKAKKFWGKCHHVGGIWKFITGYEFVIQMNHEVWQTLTDIQREALTFHELKHVGYNPATDKYSIIDHDLEEFASVIKRYGMWRESITQFTNVAMKKIHDLGEEQE